MLTIKEIPVSGRNHPEPPAVELPRHEFTMGVIAPKGSGKTTMLINLLQFYKGYFHQIIIFSPTLKNDEKWAYVRNLELLAENVELRAALKKINEKKRKNNVVAEFIPPEIVEGQPAEPQSKKSKFTGIIPPEFFISEYKEDDLRDIIQQQQEMIDYLEVHGYSRYVANRTLIYFDDLVGSDLFNARRDSVFKMINCNHRHLSFSMCLVSQAYMEIPKTIRLNYTCLILFEITNDQEKSTIFKEYSFGLSKARWQDVVYYCTKAKFSFLYYNKLRDEEYRLMKNFNQYIRV